MKKIFFLIVCILSLNSMYSQVSYLGLDGGFEGTATIDNASTYTVPQTGKWAKANTNLTIANETSTVRSGNNSMKVSSATASTCRVWSPEFAITSSTTKWVVQYYRRATSTTATVQNQTGIRRNTTESLSGSYTTVSVANTWEKVTYVPTAVTAATTADALILAKMMTSAGDMFYDDFAMYESSTGIDATAPSSATAASVSSPTSSTLDVSWTAASGGVDGGGYIVVRGTSDPTTVPNTNGIYAVGNTIASGMTVVYRGTGTSFTDAGLTSGTTYYYRVYTYDKAYNYATAATCNGTTSSGCTSPTTQAAALSLLNAATDGFSATWTAGSGNGTMLVVRPTASTNTLPISGTAYTPNLAWASADTINANNRVIFRTAGTSAGPVTGLTAQTQYTSTVYEYNTTGDCYNTTSPPSASIWTLSTEPTTHTASFTNAIISYNQINLSYSAVSGGADGYVILSRNDGTTPTTSGIVDGVDPGSWSLPSGTSIVNAYATGTSYNNTGLSASTTYCYLLVPFNWNGSNIQTYNYRTTATVPSTCATTPAAPSILSDIITDASFTYTSNIDYTLYQAAGPLTSTANNFGAYRFTIRDGGSSSPDSDTLPTILNSITFSSITGTSMIRAAALFDGNTMISNTPTINTFANTIAFSGLSYLTTDNSTRNLTLRVSLLTTVTDNLQMVFSIANADVAAASSLTSSQFTTFTTATSSTTSNRNRIIVTADRLIFAQQPTTTSVSNSMTPAVIVNAVDVNNNIDADFVTAIDITSTGTLTGSPVSVTATAGVATYSSLTHTVSGVGLNLTATTSGLAFSNTKLSNNFDINNVPANSYRSTSDGTWTSTGGTATWERLVSGTWSSSASPSFSSSNNIYIRNNVSVVGSTTASSIIVENGGIFTNSSSCTYGGTLCRVEKGGILQINASVTIGGSFEVQDSGTVILNFAFGTPSSSIWSGTENFHPQSNLIITNWDFANDPLIPDNTSISTNTYNGYTACFGNVKIDAGSNATAWTILAAGTTINLAHKNLEFLSNSGNITVAGTGTVTSGIGGDFYIDDLYTGTNIIQMKTSGVLNFTINGSMNLDAATTRLFTSSLASSTSTINVNGNINVTPSAVLEFNSTVAGGPPAPLVTVNLKGDLTVAGSAVLQNSNTSSLGILNFNGTGNGLYDSTTQTIDIATTSTNENKNISFNVLSGSYVKLINRDFELGNNSGVYVQTGGTFDFGFNGTTPLNVAISGSQNGTVFQSLQGSTLKITSTDGISTTGSIGNVRTVATNRSFNQTATFWYIGKANQVTGNGITVGSTPKVIICELIDNSTELSFTNSTSISSTTTVDATYGGHLYIKKGKVMETTTAYITGAGGTLRMEPGTYYYIPKGNVDLATADADPIPRLSSLIHPSDQYYLTGGTIELAGSGASEAFQSLRGNSANPKVYKNVVFSGANTYLTDYKNLTSTVVIDSTLYITGNAVVECLGGASTPQSFTGNGALIMDGNARIRFRKLSTPQPELLAIATSPARNYSLTGNSTVEFYNTSSSQNQLLRGKDGKNSIISYANIDINAAAANTNNGSSFYNVSASNADFQITGNLNINSPAVFRFDETETVSGTGNIIVSAGATLLYGSSNGIKTSGTGASDGNILVSGTRTLSTGASYGFIGNGTMVTGNGLPSQMVNMYIDKQTAGDLITLTNSATTTGNIEFKTAGIIKTNSNTLYQDNTAVGSIIGAVTSGSDKYIQGRLQRKVDGASTYTFPIGHSTQNAQGFTITPTGTSGSNILGYLESNSTTPTQTVAYCDLETNPGPSGSTINVGSGSTGYDGILDQVTFNLSSPLQWDITNPGGGISSYNLTVLANGTQDISPITSANGTAIRFLMKNGEPGNAGVTTGAALPSFNTVGFISCPTGYSLSGLTSFSKFTLNGANAGSTELPVTLTHFNVQLQNDKTALLNWSTSSEINNDYFNIERSADAIHFETIGKVKGNGNSTTINTYRFIDQQPLSGINYYRLNQVDFDTKNEYSPIRSVMINGSSNTNVSLYPNPTSSTIYIDLTNLNEDCNIEITDLLGHPIWSYETTMNKAVQVDLEQFPAGNYILHIVGNTINQQVKITKQ